jgi:hypothetical protein
MQKPEHKKHIHVARMVVNRGVSAASKHFGLTRGAVRKLRNAYLIYGEAGLYES